MNPPPLTVAQMIERHKNRGLRPAPTLPPEPTPEEVVHDWLAKRKAKRGQAKKL